MLTDIRALADHFLMALPNINSGAPTRFSDQTRSNEGIKNIREKVQCNRNHSANLGKELTEA